MAGGSWQKCTRCGRTGTNIAPPPEYICAKCRDAEKRTEAQIVEDAKITDWLPKLRRTLSRLSEFDAYYAQTRGPVEPPPARRPRDLPPWSQEPARLRYEKE